MDLELILKWCVLTIAPYMKLLSIYGAYAPTSSMSRENRASPDF
jgi:hypothetical protein